MGNEHKTGWSVGRVPGFRVRDDEETGRRYLEDVISGCEVGDVDPLAVDVVTVQIPAAHSDALVPEVGTLVSLGNTCEQKHSVTVTKCVENIK